jgi:hypothetical protein
VRGKTQELSGVTLPEYSHAFPLTPALSVKGERENGVRLNVPLCTRDKDRTGPAYGQLFAIYTGLCDHNGASFAGPL